MSVSDGLLQEYLRLADPHASASEPLCPGAENQQAAESAAPVAEALSREADAGRLRFLAAFSEALIVTPDTGESAGKLVELVVPRLGDGAIVSAVGDDGQSGQESHHHRSSPRCRSRRLPRRPHPWNR